MKNKMKGALIYVVIFIVILGVVTFFSSRTENAKNYNLTQVLDLLKEGKVEKVKIEGNSIQGVTKDGSEFRTYVPGMVANHVGKLIYDRAFAAQLETVGSEPAGRPIILEFIMPLVTIGIFILFWTLFMDSTQGGGKAMSFGKSKAKLHKEDDTKITFEDVAGLKEEKEELKELVDFLKNPRRYQSMGARIPKGVLMVGPPGTGKTYLSKAVAGEAKVPFFSISGSDFVEMFVGVGASRVREMFAEAKKHAPAIVFIDEIDAVGRRRGAGLGGGHDEREQTLNQLLVEMDGFDKNESVIIIAATNRPDILDPALLRPGRFDRQVSVGRPDIGEREQMLKIHARNKPIAEDVDFKVIARGTPGFTPADLENVMNEAAIIATRKGKTTIDMRSIEEATTKMMVGIEKKTRVMDEKEVRLTAYHEAGHAVLAKLVNNGDPVHQVTIIPRGNAGGFTLQLPENDRSYQSKAYMNSELIVLLGGRLAEKIILGDISTGASSDLQRVSSLARAMVTKYGMSDNLSVMAYDSQDEVFIGRDMGHMKNLSEQVMAEIDREVSKLVDEAYNKAETMLRENIDALHRVAQTLIEFETINGLEFEVAFEKGADGVRELRDANGGEMTYTLFNKAKKVEEQRAQDSLQEAEHSLEEGLTEEVLGDVTSKSDEVFFEEENLSGQENSSEDENI